MQLNDGKMNESVLLESMRERRVSGGVRRAWRWEIEPTMASLESKNKKLFTGASPKKKRDRDRDSVNV